MKPSKTLFFASLFIAASASEAAAQAPAYDDGHVMFSVENHQVRREGHGREFFDGGWSLKAWGRVLAPTPRASALVYVVKSGGEERVRFRCRLDNVGRSPFEMSRARECSDDDAILQGTGQFEIEVHYVDGDSDEDTVVAQHTIEVLEATQTGRLPHRYVNQNGEVLRAIVGRTTRHNAFSGYGGGHGNAIEIVTFVAPVESNRENMTAAGIANGSTLRARCSVNGNRIATGIYHVGDDALDNVRHGDDERVGYTVVHYILQVSWGQDPWDTEWPTLEANPGRWECSFRNEDGVVSRTFSFNVSGGDILPHPEEANDFTIGVDAHLADVRIADNGVFETRVDPAAPGRLGIGYGHRIQSAEMRAAASSLPRLGQPTVAQPTARQRRR